MHITHTPDVSHVMPFHIFKSFLLDFYVFILIGYIKLSFSGTPVAFYKFKNVFICRTSDHYLNLKQAI